MIYTMTIAEKIIEELVKKKLMQPFASIEDYCYCCQNISTLIVLNLPSGTQFDDKHEYPTVKRD